MCEGLAPDLLGACVVAPVENATPRVRMRVHVEVDEQAALSSPVSEPLERPEDAFVLRRVRGGVATVQVEAAGVGAGVAPCHAVGVEHRHELEDKVLAQELCTGIVAKDELQEAEEGELRRCLPWVHTGRDKDDLAPVEELGGRLPGGCDASAAHADRRHLDEGLAVCFRRRLGDCEQVHRARIICDAEPLPVEVDARAGTWAPLTSSGDTAYRLSLRLGRCLRCLLFLLFLGRRPRNKAVLELVSQHKKVRPLVQAFRVRQASHG
mmetsp:Transcript_112556/g.251413  ORF Transcript_112556/g.251413 Transcript_112556/m.251413 type:complete len:266 (-) Transcript_112556:957-1754(-)